MFAFGFVLLISPWHNESLLLFSFFNDDSLGSFTLIHLDLGGSKSLALVCVHGFIKFVDIV